MIACGKSFASCCAAAPQCSGPRRSAVASLAARRREAWRLRLARAVPEAPGEQPQLPEELPEGLPELGWADRAGLALVAGWRRAAAAPGPPDRGDICRAEPSSWLRELHAEELRGLHARLARLRLFSANVWRSSDGTRAGRCRAMLRARCCAAVLAHVCAERDSSFPKTVGEKSGGDPETAAAAFGAHVAAVAREALTGAGWAALDELLVSENVWPNAFARRVAADAAHHAPSLRLALALGV